jgi:hypothetical protein
MIPTSITLHDSVQKSLTKAMSSSDRLLDCELTPTSKKKLSEVAANVSRLIILPVASQSLRMSSIERLVVGNALA